MELVDIKLGEQTLELVDGTQKTLPIQTYDKLAELVKAIATKHPTWGFKTNNVMRGYESVEIMGKRYNQVKYLYSSEITVMQGRVELGNIGVETYGTRKLYISNPRIQNERRRGTATRTSDLKKAIKLVQKTFFPKTDAELVKELSKHAKEVAHDHARRQRQFVDSLWRDMHPSAFSFVQQHIEAYKEFTKYHQNPVRNIDKLDDMLEARRTSKEFLDNYEAGSACYVTLLGDTFNFSFCNKEPITITRDEVPAEIKGRVGMLKLVPNVSEVATIGLKCSDDVYLINMPNNVRLVEKQNEAS
jgi:hypothetical protein